MSDIPAFVSEDQKRTVKDVFRVVPLVFRFLWQVGRGYLILTCFFMSLTALIPAAIVYMTKVIIDGVLETSSQDLSPATMILPLVALLGLWLARSIFGSIEGFIQQMLGEQALFSAQRMLMQKAGELDLAFFENPRFYDRLHHANQHFYQMTGIYFSILAFLQQAISLTAMVSLLSILHPLAILLLLLTVLPRIFTEAFLANKHYQMESDLIRNTRMTNYIHQLMTTRDSAKEIRSFTLQDHFLGKFQIFRRIHMRALRALIFLTLKVRSGLDLFSLSGLIFIWAYAVFEAIDGTISIGDLAMVFQAAQQSQSMLSGLISSGGNVFQSSLFVTRFFDFLDLDTSSVAGSLVRPPENKKPRPVPEKITQGFAFENVSFRYPQNEKLVLKDVSFRIPVGSKVALAGENGSGKTTIVKLLTRLYDPTEGRILLDGIDLREFDPDEFHKKISVVYQDYFRYDFSASENVGLGQANEITNQDRVVAAAKKSGANAIIEKLPQKYATILGKTFHEGIDLSGGEWQHLAIARGFMSEAELLILDEPTASLDAFRERDLHENVATVAKDKTVVFISHRFSTVLMATNILVLEEGMLIEEGTHETLLARDGLYASMFNAQASRYREV